MIDVVMDITARRRDDLQRAEVQRTMQLALEVARAGTWSWRIADDRVTGDANLARLFRVPVEDLVAARLPSGALFAAVHPEDMPRVTERVRAALQTGGDYETELRVIGRLGASPG